MIMEHSEKTYVSPDVVTECVSCEKGFCDSTGESVPGLEGWFDEEQI